MTDFELIKKIAIENDNKILFLVIDGLGDIPHPGYGNKTPLQAAKLPHLDKMAKNGACGLSIPIAPGITPGSGPAHLSLFGYDPVKYDVGRGILSALGVGMDLRDADVAARVNFCNLDDKGFVTDRRAGRIPTEVCRERCEKLSGIKIDGVEFIIEPEMEYRAALIIRGKGLGGEVSDTDPQVINEAPFKAKGLNRESDKTAELVNKYVEEVKERLKDYDTANGILLRGIDTHRKIPQMQDIYKLNPACIATYPMYKGVTKLLGMEVLETGMKIKEEFTTLKDGLSDTAHDFFYVHIKKTDSAGEDGNFEKKVEVLGELDLALKGIDELGFRCIVVCGDHSTPCVMKAHSWHPVPFLIYGDNVRTDSVERFTEHDCAHGSLGVIPATEIIPQVLASAGKLKKFGA